ncbi:MAG TPA: TonB-dependent receptor [Terriglobales bacterium]|nr:TonB-dependent receptor [Terriglobales bacterium]
MRTLRPIILGIFVLFSISLWGQVATTSLHGTVFDAQGAAVPKVALQLEAPATGFSRTTTSNAQGAYEFPQVPPGTYTITAAASGFATTKVPGILLVVNTPATQNLTLKVAGTETIVEVEAQSELVNTQDATIGNDFEAKQMLNLPFEGRDPVGILSLQPGVAYVGGSNVDQTYDSRGGSVNGARSDQTNITLDGVDDNNQNLGNAFQGSLRSTLDSLEEFRVTTTNSNADSGRSSGAQVSLMTKSGTNNFHGSIYEYNRSDIGEANDWFNEQAQIRSALPNVPGQLIRNTFGAAIGGPIKRDKLFFFATYEGQRTRENLQVTRTVPSTLLRQGTIQYLDANSNLVQLDAAQVRAMDPLGIGPDPAVLQILNTYPVPNSTAAGDGLNFVGYTFPASTPSKLDTYILKLDANITPHQTMYVRGNLQNDNLVTPNSTDAPQFPGQPAGVDNRNNAKGLAVGHVWTVSKNVINNARYGYVRLNTDAVGLQNKDVITFRGLDYPAAQTSTDAILMPLHNFIDDVSWTKGTHTIQFGGNWRIINDIRSVNDLSFLGAETNPSWLASSGFANNNLGFDPPEIGQPAVSTNFGQSYDLAMATLGGVISEGFANYTRTKSGAVLPDGSPADRHFKSNELETYLQDSWRVRPNLTLTFGARYTLLQPPYEVNGVQVGPTTSINNWLQNRAAAMVQGQTYDQLLTFNLIGQGNGRQPYWAWDYKDIAPRFAVAWSPNRSGDDFWSRLVGNNGKTSVRAGFGIYYDHYGEGIVNSFDKLGSFGLSTQISNPAGIETAAIAPRVTGLYNMPPICNTCVLIPAPTGGFPLTPPASPAPGGFEITWGMDNKIQTPYSEVIDLSLTRELPHGFVLEGSYVGRLSHHLLQEEDMAMPLDIRDPQSGMDYFTAGTMLSKAFNAGTPISSLASIPYWQHMFPAAAGQPGFGSGGAGCAPNPTGMPSSSFTATQAVYDLWSCFVGNETSALQFLDFPGLVNPVNPANPATGCVPSCSKLGPFSYFSSQYSSLFAWRSIGSAAYNGAQLVLRHKGHGFDFDFNYVYSKVIDVGSNAERINEFEGGGFASQVINTWSPKQLRAVSDFDTTHQLNSNWVYDLPIGKGKYFGGGMHGIGQALLGGWTITGIFRWTSGYPFTVEPGLGFWATNWQLTSADVLIGPKPTTGTFTDPSGNPNVFKGDPIQIGQLFRPSYPGESGERNNLRGPGYFGIDSGLAKIWNVTERQLVRFSWEVFNITNTPRFDVGSMQNIGNNSVTSGSVFGEYTKTMTAPRIMQFSLRYSF